MLPMRFNLYFTLLVFFSMPVCAQQNTDPSYDLDSLRREILALRTEVNTIQVNLGDHRRGFQLGILTATLGYSVTIAGGQLLGGRNNDLGVALLYTGGGIGILGTALLMNSYRYIGKAAGMENRKKKTRP
jgi:hypothetical protein